jgi:hypothetical protein
MLLLFLVLLQLIALPVTNIFGVFLLFCTLTFGNDVAHGEVNYGNRRNRR